jgi:hypothetical protein
MLGRALGDAPVRVFALSREIGGPQRSHNAVESSRFVAAVSVGSAGRASGGTIIS